MCQGSHQGRILDIKVANVGMLKAVSDVLGIQGWSPDRSHGALTPVSGVHGELDWAIRRAQSLDERASGKAG